jgi:phage shock protein A
MFKRIGNLFRGFFGLFIGGLERKNPEALLDVEKENLRGQIAKYNKGLAGHAALCERLISQTRALENEEKELHAKVVANLRAGNKELAGQYALRHQQVKKEHENIKSQMEEAEKTYKELLTARDVIDKAARDKIESLKRGINEAKIAQATAELNEMASGMIGEIGTAGDTLNRLEEIVREDKEKAAGRARVAKDSIDMSGITAKASEQAAMEDLALADFAAAEGIAIEKPVSAGTASPSPGTNDSTKTMGPAQTE